MKYRIKINQAQLETLRLRLLSHLSSTGYGGDRHAHAIAARIRALGGALPLAAQRPLRGELAPFPAPPARDTRWGTRQERIIASIRAFEAKKAQKTRKRRRFTIDPEATNKAKATKAKTKASASTDREKRREQAKARREARRQAMAARRGRAIARALKEAGLIA